MENTEDLVIINVAPTDGAFRAFMAENGYELKTTFWEDFTIAERDGLLGIKDTYDRAFEEWKNNVEYLTELVLVLNHKIHQHYGKRNLFASAYNVLWKETCEWAVNNLTGEDLS